MNAHLDQCLDRRPAVLDQIIVPPKCTLLEKKDQCGTTEREPPEFIPSFDRVTGLDGRADTANHCREKTNQGLGSRRLGRHVAYVLIAPIQIVITRPNNGLSIGTIFRTFSPYTSKVVLMACGFTV